MCQFKSGVILKNNVKIAEGADDSHSNLLESLGIEDNYINATKMFVRAELVPKNGAWWISPKEEPDKWEFIVDQDIVPGWFDDTEYEQRFREAVCAWWDEHIFVDRVIDELNSGYYRLKRCEVKKLCKDVVVMLGSSTVQRMYDSSTVQRMLDNSTVQEMHDNSVVQRMYDSSTVQEIYDNSTVRRMYGSSTVQRMHGSSTVQEMCGSSTVQRMHGSSTVQRMHDSSTVQRMHDSSTVQEMCGSSTARDFRNYPKIKIIFPPDGEDRFEMVALKKEDL